MSFNAFRSKLPKFFPSGLILGALMLVFLSAFGCPKKTNEAVAKKGRISVKKSATKSANNKTMPKKRTGTKSQSVKPAGKKARKASNQNAKQAMPVSVPDSSDW